MSKADWTEKTIAVSAINRVERETEKAMLIELDGISKWFPKSQVIIDETPTCRVIICPTWLWNKEIKNCVPFGFSWFYDNLMEWDAKNA